MMGRTGILRSEAIYMSAGSKWYHVNGNTYGTWLHGDRRGWRSRHGRDHCTGDYKNPPAAGMYDRLEEYSRNIMKAEPVVLTVVQRGAACDAMLEKFIACGVKVIALSVGAKHYHILAQFPDARVRHWVGLAKKSSSRILGKFGLPGRVWARKCRALPIVDRSHQVNTFEYILAHRQQGSRVWTFRDGPLETG
ncbi:MAG: hypothetical protein QGG42_19955 [Phycisphaerae bacterium]|nr:hypothetical protein [Phycisphaerae bacterium]